MESLKIRKSIAIPASKAQVWKVLLDDTLMRIWYAEFSEGAHAISDWKEGCKAIFTDNTNGGMVGRIGVLKPNEKIVIDFEGILTPTGEDYESEAAQQIKGGQEIYTLTEKDGHTLLSIESDMTPEYFEPISAAWDKALQKISDLAVNQGAHIPENSVR